VIDQARREARAIVGRERRRREDHLGARERLLRVGDAGTPRPASR
jgi:hypothetical protein